MKDRQIVIKNLLMQNPAYVQYLSEFHAKPYLKIGYCKESVTLAKAGGYLKPRKTWIPACAGMTTGCKPMMKRNFEIGPSIRNPYDISPPTKVLPPCFC